MSITDEILSAVPAEQMSTVLVLGGGDYSFMVRCRDAYPKAFMSYVDSPNNIRLFKVQHPDCYGRIPNMPLPMNNMKALRYDFIAAFNFFAMFKTQVPQTMHYICYEMMQADAMLFVQEDVGEYNGVSLLDEAEKYFTIETEFAMAVPGIAALCKRKGTPF
jgi:hypothetical protein